MKMTKQDSMKVIFSNSRKIVANSRWFGWFKGSKQSQLLRVSFEVTFSQSSNRVDDVHSETIFDVWLFGKNISVFFCSEGNVMSKTTFFCDTGPCIICQEGREGGKLGWIRKIIIASQTPRKCCSIPAMLWKSLQASKAAKFRVVWSQPYPSLSLPILSQQFCSLDFIDISYQHLWRLLELIKLEVPKRHLL